MAPAQGASTSAGTQPRVDPASPPVGASITLVTNDVPGAIAAATAAGARTYTEPIEKPWDQTVAYLIDPSRILLEVASPVG